MPRKTLKRLLPRPDKMKAHKSLQMFGYLLHQNQLWHLHRRSASVACAIGLFCAFVPIPFQMVLAAAIAIFCRVNLPLSVALVWLSNPLTMPPLFYGCYLLGTLLLGTPSQPFDFELSFEWLGNKLVYIWEPFLLGCFVVATVSAILGYVGMQLIWRYSVLKSWRSRTFNRLKSGLKHQSKRL